MIDHFYQGHRRLGEIFRIRRSSVVRGIRTKGREREREGKENNNNNNKENIYTVECNTD